MLQLISSPGARNAADGQHVEHGSMERYIYSDSAPGGLTMYTFEDACGNVIGYAMIGVPPDGGIVPREVVELYDLCAAEAAASRSRPTLA